MRRRSSNHIFRTFEPFDPDHEIPAQIVRGRSHGPDRLRGHRPLARSIPIGQTSIRLASELQSRHDGRVTFDKPPDIISEIMAQARGESPVDWYPDDMMGQQIERAHERTSPDTEIPEHTPPIGSAE
jgi:hypothetical protein